MAIINLRAEFTKSYLTKLEDLLKKARQLDGGRAILFIFSKKE